MASKFAVSAEFRADDKASATIEKVEGRFSRLSRFLSDRFVITLGDVTQAFRALVGGFSSVIEAAETQENAVKSLEAALSGLGPAAASVAEQLQEQASALQQVTRYGDEAIIQQQALLATLGVQAAQIPLATQATVDLAAALGISLESAARNVGKTVGGFAGELGEVIPELKGLSTEALQAGAGIELLAEKFSGRAAADAETFAGVIDQLSNAFGDLQEKVGEAVTKNREIRDSFQSLTSVLADQGSVDAVANFASAVATLSGALVSAIVQVNEFAEDAGLLFANLTGNLENVEISTSAYEATAARLGITVEQLKQRIAENVAVQQRLNSEHREAAAAASEAAAGTAQYADSLDRVARIQAENASAAEGFTEALKQLGVVTQDEVNRQLEEHARLLEQADDLYRRGIITREDFERVERAVADANQQANDKLLDQLGLLHEYSDSTDRAARNTDRWAGSIDDATAALARQTTVERERQTVVNQGFSKNLLGGQSSFAQISGGTFSSTTNPLGRTTANVAGRINHV